MKLSSEEINVKLIAEQIEKRDISLDDMNNDKYSFKRNDLCNGHDKYYISRRFCVFPK